MAVSNFIPTVWSENLITSMDKKYIAVANCNRDYEGDIRSCGDRVKICGVGDIAIFDYVKNTDIENSAQTLDDTCKTLVIDQAKAFNFQIDDIDSAQSNPRLMDLAVKNAASALANVADKYIYSLYSRAENVTEAEVDINNILDVLIMARTRLIEKDIQDPNDIVFEVSPVIGALIMKNKLNVTSSETLLETGCIGNVAGCKVFVSNNIVTEGDVHMCFARSKRAIAFAEQLSEIDAYRPEKRFADAVKGLHLYGAEVVYPEEFTVLKLTPDISALLA